MSSAFSVEAVTEGIEEALNLLFHLIDYISWMMSLLPIMFFQKHLGGEGIVVWGKPLYSRYHSSLSISYTLS